MPESRDSFLFQYTINLLTLIVGSSYSNIRLFFNNYTNSTEFSLNYFF